MDKRGYQEKRKKQTTVLRNTILWIGLLCGILISATSFSQELFPTMEPASTMPKSIFGVRQINEVFRSYSSRIKYYNGIRLMYGLTKNMTVMSTIGLSNHHLEKIPDNFTGYLVNHHSLQYPKFPYLLEGVHVYAKYRLINFDEEQKHFRIAVYAEGTKSFVAHTEGESNLTTDNSGYGGGVIFTRLQKRFAASVTWGFIKSLPYYQNDGYRTLGFKSGDVTMYNIAFGYRLYPRVYKSYKNSNVNLYTEFINRVNAGAEVSYNGIPYDYSFLMVEAPYTYSSFIANQYSEMRSSIQFIFDSSTRLDVGMAIPVYSRSYLHDYPLVFVNIQKYFFR